MDSKPSPIFSSVEPANVECFSLLRESVDFPKLRNINVFPVQMSGQTLLCLQDPQNISEKAVFLPLPTYFIVSLFDGQHSILDIQAAYMRRFGEFVFTEKINEIITQLEENLFLEGDRFREALREKEEDFKKASIREAAFAGKSYEQDPEHLRVQLEGYFGKPDGPGPLGEKKEANGLKGVVAPHIDFQRGGLCYAFAHREIWERNSSNDFVIFGTAHTSMENPFCLTRKDFMTPLGTLSVDRELIDAIQSRCSYDLFKDEGVHQRDCSPDRWPENVPQAFFCPQPAAPLCRPPGAPARAHEVRHVFIPSLRQHLCR